MNPMDAQLSPPINQTEVIKRLTPEQRYKAGRQLYWTLRRHKRAFLRSLHPDWSDAELDAEVRRVFANARN